MSSSRDFFAALSITLILKAAIVLPALVLADIIDNINSDLSILRPLGLFIALIVLQALATPIQAWSLARLCQERVRSMSAKWCRALLDKRFEAYEQLHGGALVKVLDRGITAQERWLNFLIGSAWPVLAEALVLGTLFIYLGAASVLLGLIPLSLVYLWANGSLIRWRRPHIEAVNTMEDDLAELWVDTFATATSVKLERAESAAMMPVEQTLGRYAKAAVRVASSGAWLQAARIVFIGLGSSGLLAWGMVEQARAEPSITLGELVALFTLVSGLLASVAQVAEGWRMLDQFKVDRQRLDQWLKLPPFGPDASETASDMPEKSILQLGSCSLAEDGHVRLQLDQSLVIQPGERVALAGPSGSGKSTLLHALAGTLDPLRMHLRLGDKPIERLGAATQFTHIRLSPQRPRFVPGPLSRAVLLDQAHDQERVKQWLERLGLGADWYERELDGRGNTISGGEARRLSLLRVLNRPGEFNLFDEPTSGLDTALAHQIWDLLFEELAGRGLVCVTHDQAALRRFDRVIWVAEGRVVEEYRSAQNVFGAQTNTSGAGT
ncbi:ATP-binding cassette domain-containing protein [Pseudomonas capeferrum]|uniref:ATP-binding cassette domain-containing protein n=1 Tax=Pseudomonas capeferrum TaxID=1495066 RepID=UPI0015E436CE|nr:ATP-binding cassette domain-containing protein [Pseudomonas capeferrum]MBA1202847.1 ATP-binding cassette domain-containing protein [Pseudomonas capeferrum]